MNSYSPLPVRNALLALDIAQKWFKTAERTVGRAERCWKRLPTEEAGEWLVASEAYLVRAGELLVAASEAYVQAGVMSGRWDADVPVEEPVG